MKCAAKSKAAKNTKHGGTYGPLYNTWQNMRRRCTVSTNAHFHNYGGRDPHPVRVCSRYLGPDGFAHFQEDLSPKPEGHTIDRKTNDGPDSNYSCGKCDECVANGWSANIEWADRFDQANNARPNVVITHDGQTKTLAEWCKDLDLPYSSIWRRLQEMPFAEAIAMPIRDVGPAHITHDGRTMRLHEWAAETGLPASDIHRRINYLNWSVERALTTPKGEGRKKMITWRGKTQSIKEWAKEVGLPYSTVTQRIANGVELDLALTVPADHKNGFRGRKSPRPS